MKRSVLLGLLALLLLLPGLASAQDSAPAGAIYTSEVVPCPSAIANGLSFRADDYIAAYHLTNLGEEVEGQTFECGIVYVPENYAQPEGRLIGLFYLRFFSFSDTPAPDPVINLAGGPGGSGTNDGANNPLSLNTMNVSRRARDIVFFDQRGTGWSNYLLCAPFTSAIGALLEQAEDPEVDALFADLFSNPIASAGLMTALCGAVYSEMTDVDLTQYNSLSSAQDILHLAESLGYTEGYNLYGGSYGTRLAQNAMRSTPDTVRSVVLDGPTGPGDNNVFSTVNKFPWQYRNVVSYCAADPACNAAYPNLGERFSTLLTRLQTEPLVLDPPILGDTIYRLPPVISQIDTEFFINLASSSDDFSSNGFGNAIPRTILAIEEGDIDYLRSIYGVEPPPEAATEVAAPPIPQPVTNVLPVDQPLFQASITSLLMLAQNFAGIQDLTIDMAWVNISLQDFEARLLAGEDQSTLMLDLIEWSVLPNNRMDAQGLIDFANASLTPAAAASANALVAQMSRNDVRSTYWRIQDIAMNLGAPPNGRSSSSVMQAAVNCAEDIPFATLEDAQAYIDSSPFPQLALGSVDIDRQFIAGCLTFPTVLDESITEPVVSDIPALVYVGGMDTHTPSDWGVNVQSHLSNSTLVEFQNYGHVTATKDGSGCAGDIAAAFFDDPTTPPDVSCALAAPYTMRFVLPE